MFENAEDEFRKSVHSKTGGHYNTYALKDESRGVEFLKSYFDDGEGCNDMNMVFLATSGIHGSYITLDDVQEWLEAHPGASFESWDGGEGGEEESWPTVTFLLVQPRIVGMTYGNAVVRTLEEVAWLRWLAHTTVGGVAKSLEGCL